jgi:hypothetical protein
MSMNLLAVGYIAVALLLAWVGRRTRIGPIIIFLTSIVLTPILPLVYLVIASFERRA